MDSSKPSPRQAHVEDVLRDSNFNMQTPQQLTVNRSAGKIGGASAGWIGGAVNAAGRSTCTRRAQRKM
eukprot:CAMPEP_0202111530 /NCGR_PEP_ID=MMETSP0965-20130614/29409_1 /ASSEMBLY_ACC=CAM_ASM_000507 /TAXON_ID=4773 /ORGANISM="Schizochytrium aggregatum, Strain ATCC28209" /LENGTH=67 /DNA_ID=CAMNT_0048681027 /DNA_START=57 /DNA_END=257 /DNA_ORIENTATION=-